MRAILKWIRFIGLYGVLEWAFHSFAWDTTVHILESKVGISEAQVIAGISSVIIPGAIAFLALAGAFKAGKRSATVAAPTNVTRATDIPTVTATSEESWPFLIQAAVILALVSGGVGYYLNAYISSGVVDPLAIKKRFTEFHDYTEISGRTYRHETVRLDGLRCHECTFDDVVTLWNGTAPFDLDNSVFLRNDQGKIAFNVRSENPIISYTERLLSQVEGFNPNVYLRSGHGPP
jgi:hypothetical protein